MSTTLQQPNMQGLDIQSTRREEMKLYALDTFPYEFAGKEIKIKALVTIKALAKVM